MTNPPDDFRLPPLTCLSGERLKGLGGGKVIVVMFRGHQTNCAEYNNVKKELRDIEDLELQGAIIRSKTQWHEEGERNTKYFLGLEKQRSNKKTMKKLEYENGKTTTDPIEILNAQTDFYRTLYSSQHAISDTLDYGEMFQYVDKIEDSDRNELDSEITFDEYESVIKSFKRGTSPGNDGLTVEFYQYFWNDLKESFVKCINQSYELNELPTSQKQSITTLFDKGKDRNFLKNWRPISLLNVDYKIISKVIANRIKSVLPKIIDVSQSGFYIRSIYERCHSNYI